MIYRDPQTAIMHLFLIKAYKTFFKRVQQYQQDHLQIQKCVKCPIFTIINFYSFIRNQGLPKTKINRIVLNDKKYLWKHIHPAKKIRRNSPILKIFLFVARQEQFLEMLIIEGNLLLTLFHLQVGWNRSRTSYLRNNSQFRVILDPILQQLILLLIIIYFSGLQMGNGQFYVPQHISNEWTQSFRNNKKYLKNKITLEEFEFIVLQKFEEFLEISLLIERSIYSIPKTPKIIILNNQKEELFILVQDYEFQLAQNLPKIDIVTDFLGLLKQTFSVFLCLVKKYGPFGISQSMMGLNKNMEILAWINQQRQKNEIQFPLDKSQSSQKLMISQILGIYKKYTRCCFNFQQLYISKNIQQALLLINKIITRRKIEMAANCTLQKKKCIGYRRALSPQTSVGGFGQTEIEYSKNEGFRSKLNKRNQVPNFLKRMTQKKMNFLDVINHKRTVTLEQNQKQFMSKEKKIFDLKVNKYREKCQSKLLNKVRSLNGFTSKDKNINFSSGSGQLTKISFANINQNEKKYDFFTQSGSSGSFLNKKRVIHDLKAQKALAKTQKFQCSRIKHTKQSSQQSPTYTQNSFKPWQANRFSYRFPAPQNIKPKGQSEHSPEYNVKVQLLAFCNTSQSTYLNEPSHQKNTVINEQIQCIPKTLEDEVNDFFSNHSRSPRYTFQALPESNELAEQFSKVIDF